MERRIVIFSKGGVDYVYRDVSLDAKHLAALENPQAEATRLRDVAFGWYLEQARALGWPDDEEYYVEVRRAE